MYNTLFYLSMMLQLANPSYKQRDAAYNYLLNNPHRLVEIGLYSPHPEIKQKCYNVLVTYYERKVNSFGYTPMIDSTWYDEVKRTYDDPKPNGFLGTYNTIYLKTLLNEIPYYDFDNDFFKYRLATRYWLKELIYEKVNDKEIIRILTIMRKRDLIYLKTVQHSSYPTYLYLEAKSSGL